MFASLFSRDAAQAGHDGTNVLHLGEGNGTPPGRKTGVASDVGSFAFDIDNFNTGPTGGGLHGRSLGGLPALQGVGHEPSFAGVFGVSSPASGELGTGSRTGVAGLSGSGAGVDGRSESGIGVSGHSEAGIGARFSSSSGRALETQGTVRMHAESADAPALEVFNLSGEALGIHAPSVMEPGPAPTDGPTLAIFAGHVASPVAGHALRAETFGGPVAVRGIASSGFPDPVFEGGPGEGVHGSSGTGIGVVGIATGPGIGVEARAGVGGDSLDAIALNVRGKSRFSTAGAAVIPGGEEMLFVPNPAVTGESHISVTLAGDPGASHISWIERNDGTGFTVHLSRPLRRGEDVPLTYFIAEPG